MNADGAGDFESITTWLEADLGGTVTRRLSMRRRSVRPRRRRRSVRCNTLRFCEPWAQASFRGDPRDDSGKRDGQKQRAGERAQTREQ